MSAKWMKRIAIFVMLLFFGFSLLHASWLAPKPEGRPKLVATGPIDLPRDSRGCIVNAEVGYGAVAVSAETRMLQTSVGNGADGIVIDSELADGKAMLPSFFAANCPADTVRAPLTEAMTALSKPDQFIRIKDSAHAKAALAAIPADAAGEVPKRVFFAAKEADIAPLKGKPAFSIAKARQCASDYRTSGIVATVPASCAGGTMLLTLDDLGIGLWGWPDRFLARMADNDVRLIVAADVKGDNVTGLTELTQYNDIARSYNGYIWVDNIADLGPALKR